MSHTVPSDLGYRIEVRAEPVTPSVPCSGELLAYAQRGPQGWLVAHRDGRQAAVATKVQAALLLLRLVDGARPDPVPWEVLPDGSVHFHGFADSPRVDELVKTLRVLGVGTREQAVAVLLAAPVTLTGADARAVYDHFPAQRSPGGERR